MTVKQLNIVTFDLPKADAEVVERLEMLLEQAKTGELRQISYICGYVGENNTPETQGGSAGSSDQVHRIGHLKLMMFRECAKFFETVEPE